MTEKEAIGLIEKGRLLLEQSGRTLALSRELACRNLSMLFTDQ
jgi:hypothetical protein